MAGQGTQFGGVTLPFTHNGGSILAMMRDPNLANENPIAKIVDPLGVWQKLLIHSTFDPTGQGNVMSVLPTEAGDDPDDIKVGLRGIFTLTYLKEYVANLEMAREARANGHNGGYQNQRTTRNRGEEGQQQQRTSRDQ